MFRMKKNERNDLEEKPFCLWTLARSREPAALAKKISILALLLNLGTVTIPITKDKWLKLQFNGVSLNCLNPPQSKKRNKKARFFTYKVWRCERQVKIRIVRLGAKRFVVTNQKSTSKDKSPLTTTRPLHIPVFETRPALGEVSSDLFLVVPQQAVKRLYVGVVHEGQTVDHSVRGGAFRRRDLHEEPGHGQGGYGVRAIVEIVSCFGAKEKMLGLLKTEKFIG